MTFLRASARILLGMLVAAALPACESSIGVKPDSSIDGGPDSGDADGGVVATDASQVPLDAGLDSDEDGILDEIDNCPSAANASQSNRDGDDDGDDCDPCPDEADTPATCGDGLLCTAREACDDGYEDACGTCNDDCSGPGEGAECGDGDRCPEFEDCDDGYEDACGSCDRKCTGPGAGAVCGDGDRCPELEKCDDDDTSVCGECNANCSGPGHGDTPPGDCGSKLDDVSLAVKVLLDVWWQDTENDPDLIDPGRSVITQYFHIRIPDTRCNGSMSTAEVRVCGLEVPPFVSDANCDAFQLTFPDEMWDEPSMPTFATTSEATGFEPGDILTLAEATNLLGIDLMDPDDDWPASTDVGDFEVLDDDDDSEPGITIEMDRIGETFTELGNCGANLPFIFRGVPLETISAIFDDGEKAAELYIGLRSRLSASGEIAETCDEGAGESTASFFDTRVFDCTTTMNRRCIDHPDYGTAARDFVDRQVPGYRILEGGEAPPATVVLPSGLGGGPLDQTPSPGPLTEFVVLGNADGDFTCADIRAAFPPP